MLKHLLALIPPHRIYVEVFGGAAHLLFAKPQSEIEVYNDIDENVVNFFRVLRDPEKSRRLQELLRFTPYSRKEFYFCRDNLNETGIDDVERARRFFVINRQSFNADPFQTGWAWDTSRHRAKTVASIVDRLHVFAERLRTVQIECDDFEKIIRRYDSPDTFFYCDPPYILTTLRRNPPYSMSEDDHRRLVRVLLTIRGKALLSGYDHEIYRPLERAGWHKKRVRRMLSAANPHHTGPRRRYQYEYLWFNYDPSQ